MNTREEAQKRRRPPESVGLKLLKAILGLDRYHFIIATGWAVPEVA